MIKAPANLRSIESLKEIMRGLLSTNGCPWDRAQTPKSIVPNMIEEAHEAAEAIERDDLEGTKEELGDVLLQVIFQSAMAENLNQFALEDVIEKICTKLVTRHPHVFGDVKAENAEQALDTWTAMKKKEKKNSSEDPISVPHGLSSLQRAHKIGVKTKDLAFDWSKPSEVMEKVDEELDELKLAIKNNDRENIEEELGDMMFVLAQLARHLGFEAETASRRANIKFEERFKWMINKSKTDGKDFQSLSLQDKEALWTESKKYSPRG
jgi:MazG family protein